MAYLQFVEGKQMKLFRLSYFLSSTLLLFKYNLYSQKQFLVINIAKIININEISQIIFTFGRFRDEIMEEWTII